MRDILETYTATELRKFISEANIKGITKMKKPELIKEMTKPKHINRFKHIKKKGEKQKPKIDIRKSKPTPTFLKIKDDIKKKADKIKAERAKAVKPSPAKKTTKKPLTITTADGKISTIKMKSKSKPKPKIPTITITEAPKQKKEKQKEIKSSLGKIPTPKTKIRIQPKKKEEPKPNKEDIIKTAYNELFKTIKDKNISSDDIRNSITGKLLNENDLIKNLNKSIDDFKNKTNRLIENRLKSKNKNYSRDELIKQIVKNTNVDNFDTLLLKYSKIQKLLNEKKENKLKPFKDIFNSGKAEKIMKNTESKKEDKKEPKKKEPKKKAPKKKKDKKGDVLDVMDERKEEEKKLKLKILKTKDKKQKEELKKQLKKLKNKPIIEKATIQKDPVREAPKRDDELEAFLSNFDKGGETLKTTKKEEPKKKEAPKQQQSKFTNPIQKIKNYIKNDLIKDYKTIPKGQEYSKEKRTIIKKLNVLQRNLVDSDIPYNLENLAKEFTNDIDKVAKENDISTNNNRLDIFKRGLGLVKSRTENRTFNVLEERQQDIDKLVKTLDFLKTVDEKRLKKTGKVIDDLKKINEIETDKKYRTNKKQTDEEKNIKAEISKRMRQKDYLKDVYKLSTNNLGLLFELKGVPERIFNEVQKIKTPLLPTQFTGSKGQNSTKKDLIKLYEDFLKRQRKDDLI